MIFNQSLKCTCISIQTYILIESIDYPFINSVVISTLPINTVAVAARDISNVAYTFCPKGVFKDVKGVHNKTNSTTQRVT